MPRLSRPAVITVAAAAPAVILACIEAVILLIGTVTEHPRWPDVALNLSEATAVRDHAEVVRLLERGDDPNARRPVRPGLVGNEATVDAAPVEAAVSIRRPELIALLFDHGASLSPEDWRRLRCSAAAREYDDVVEALDRGGPVGTAVACSGNEALW
jgi:hypothetical protein